MRAASASSRESAASTAASSGPRSAPVSARRSDAQVAADGLQLADDRPRLVEREPLRRGGAQLGEPLERRRARPSPSATGCGSSTRRAYSRASTSVRAPRSAGTTSTGASAAAASSSSRHRRDRVDREPPQPREIELDVVLGQVELVEVRAHRRGGNPSVAQLGDRRVPVPLRELLPVRAEDEPVVDHVRQLAAERASRSAAGRRGSAGGRAADDVRDAEVEVVDDGGELVRRRAVRAQERRAVAAEPTEPSSSRSAAPDVERPLRGRGVDAPRSLCRTGPSSKPTPSQARSSRIASSPPSTFRVGSVSSIRSTSTPPCASAKRRFATAVSAFPRWSEPGRARREADADGHGLRRRSGRARAARRRARARRGSPDTARGRSRPRARRACTRRARCPRSSSARRRGTSRSSRWRSIASSAA